jgi:bifunctional DNase/RNase
MTHDLMKNLLEEMGAEIERVVVCDLRENTFYATIHLRTRERTIAVDARPSDAIALALRTQSRILVEETVIEGARHAETSKESSDVGRLRKWLEGLTEEELGKYKM